MADRADPTPQNCHPHPERRHFLSAAQRNDCGKVSTQQSHHNAIALVFSQRIGTTTTALVLWRCPSGRFPFPIREKRFAALPACSSRWGRTTLQAPPVAFRTPVGNEAPLRQLEPSPRLLGRTAPGNGCPQQIG